MESGTQFTGADTKIKYGFINTQGQEVIKPQFDRANDFHDGLAAVYQFQRRIGGVEYNKVGWIDTTGKLVIPYQSDEYVWYAGRVHNFDQGLVCYFKQSSEGLDMMPMGGIMDKTGKPIIPASKDEYFRADNFGLNWKDGVIAVSPWAKANEKGEPTKNGKFYWPYLSLYDYSGKLIAQPKGYTDGIPLGGGYTLALHQVPVDKTVATNFGDQYPAYWSVFDRNGNIVVEKAEANNFYLLNAPYGYDNGYVFFGEGRWQVDH